MVHWKNRKINYDILIPKLHKNISDLSEAEAEMYFRWYTEQIPYRVNYVSKVCASEMHIPVERMNYSPDSLLILWRWFLRKAKTEPVTYTEQNANWSIAMKKTERQLTAESEYILRDIGMYLGETFRINNPQIYWTYYTKPRRDFFVNRPLLKGFIDRTAGHPFDAVFEPIHMVHIQAVKLLKKKSKDTDLLDLYNIWIKKV